MYNMLTSSGLSTYKFSKFLLGLNDNTTLPQNLNLGTTNLKYYDTIIIPNLTAKSFLFVATAVDGSNVNLYSFACFLANTPVNTDQGVIMIDKIDPKIHTIRKQKIVAITKTINQDKHLTQIEKNAFDKNVPSMNTVISSNHKIMYMGKMIKAKDFIGLSDKIKEIKYNGEVLYNVLMEDHNKMIINNLIVETLHPEHRLAKMYNTYHLDELSSIQKIYIIEELNNIVLQEKSTNQSTRRTHKV
jgi:hypothetical protein